ncbi:MAG TPA: ABC transporter permease [Tepidisphaeraceae bacterium]|nr:ABC transporter permease [Tepidisphaeraceae bacterium]
MSVLAATALYTTPLLIAATGELMAERAGVVNIGVEGMMLTGALAGFAVAAQVAPASGPGVAVLAGMGAAVAAAVVLGLVFAVVVVPLGADQIVAGAGVNLLAVGATALLFKALPVAPRGVTTLAGGTWWMAGVAVAGVGLVGVYLRRTRAGLELTAIGEAPHAADAAGVPVGRRKVLAICFAAACAGVAGAYLSTLRVWSFQENMTEGQGFLALAIVIFGRWSATGVLVAAAFFGLVRAVALQAEAQTGPLYPVIERVLSAVAPASRAGAADAIHFALRALPYVVTLIALAGLAGRSGSPAGLGKAYARE